MKKANHVVDYYQSYPAKALTQSLILASTRTCGRRYCSRVRVNLECSEIAIGAAHVRLELALLTQILRLRKELLGTQESAQESQTKVGVKTHAKTYSENIVLFCKLRCGPLYELMEPRTCILPRQIRPR